MTSGDKELLHTSSSEHGIHVRLGIIAGQARVEFLVRFTWRRYRRALPLRRMLWHTWLLTLRALQRVLWHAWQLITRGLRRVVLVCFSLRLWCTPSHSFADAPLPWSLLGTPQAPVDPRPRLLEIQSRKTVDLVAAEFVE